MIPLLTRAEARALDADAETRLGLPTIVLMENAGAGATEVIEGRLDALDRVVLLGGPGQNGGDAWVIARHLHSRGVRQRHLLGRPCRPLAILVGDEARVSGDAKTNLGVLRALGVEVRVVQPSREAVAPALAEATSIVDGLFGTGLDRPVRGGYAEVIDAVNASGRPVVSLDVPSGIDADTGAVLGVAVRAGLTITFAGHKRGLHQHPGVDHAGEVVAVSIGVPGPGAAVDAQLFEAEDVARVVARRDPASHKGTAGHVVVVAGAPGRTGAAWLSAHGALRGGAGLVTIASSAHAALDAKVFEMMTAPLDDAEGVLSLAEGKRAAVVGPGLGTDAQAAGLCRRLARELSIPTVLDADALTALAGDLEALRDAAGPRVLTPHPGEAARLLGSTAAVVQEDRYGAARELAERSGQTVVLKGARTIVAEGSRARVCRRGTPALGVAGTGDVLAGVIAAQLGPGPVLEPACAGVVLHALAGEIAATADRGLLAREVGDAVPVALERCRAMTA